MTKEIIYFLMQFAVLLITFIFVSERELFKSLFHTVAFIITLWLNIPCYLNVSDANRDLMYLPLKLSDEFGIVYTMFASVILCIMIYFQVKFLNNALYTHKKIKKKFDKFVNDAEELYIIGKDIDFLGKKHYKVQTECQTAHCGRCKPHFDFGVIASLIVPYRNLPQTLRGLTADCRSLV